MRENLFHTILVILLILGSTITLSAQCNFRTEYNSPFNWQSSGSSITVSSGQLQFSQTPGTPQNEYLSRALNCSLNDDNWAAQFAFQLDTGDAMGHALLYLGQSQGNPSASPGIGAYIFSDPVTPPQLVLVAQNNSNVYTSVGGAGGISIEQDSTYHIVLQRIDTNQIQLSVFEDSLRQNAIAGSPLLLNFPGSNINGLDNVIHGNNTQLPGVNFLSGSIDYLEINDGCSAKITGPEEVCENAVNLYSLNDEASYQWNTGQSTQQVNLSFSSSQMLIGTITDTNSCSASDTINIQVFDAPDANFSASSTSSSSVPFSVNFTNTSINANKWQWDFGDGATSTAKNPSHTYTTFGNYTVSLITIDSSSSCTDTAFKDIEVVAISADFTSEATVGCGPTVIQFEDLSTGAVTNWFWVFGNGSISTDQNPVAIYPNPGTYSVSLTVTDGFNSDTRNISGYIQIGSSASAPEVQFVADTTFSCSNSLTVQFTDQSTNAVEWFWEFGDGDTSVLQNPVHQYDTAGFYTVRLSVTNSIGCVRDTAYTDYIVIDPPRANFVASPSNACGPFTTNFQDLSYSQDSIVSWQWDFGDGQSSTQQNPTHLYANTGVYIATLSIEDINGCVDSYSDTIRSGSIKPSADFSSSPPRVCIGETVQFTDASVDANQWFWNFGDGTGIVTQQNPVHSFADTGLYNITLIACNDGCCDTITKPQTTEVIEPIADFNVDEPIGCAVPHEVQFTDLSFSPSTWHWDFGDGNTSSQQNPTHIYQEIGIYRTHLTVADTFTNCTDTFSLVINIDTAKTNFAAFPLSGCTPLTVQFADNSRSPVSWQWDFGNGNNASVRNPLQSYVDSGSYDISLITEVQNGCKDTLLKAGMIKAVEPDIQIANSISSGCVPLTVNFEDLTPGSVDRSWDFGNGDTSDLSQPQVTYTQPGIYDVTIEVEDQNGCSQTKVYSQLIEVFALPNVTASADTSICEQNAVHLFAQGASTYSWDNGLSGDSIYLTISKDSILIVTGIDTNACSATDTVFVEALPLPNAEAGSNDSICLGESGTLTASGGNQYLWSNNTSGAQLTAAPAITTQYRVEVTDTNGCIAEDSAQIVVRPQPMVEAGTNDTICLGQAGQLNGSGSGSLMWSNGNSGSVLIDSPVVNTTYTLTVNDAFNCTATDSASIIVENFQNAGILQNDTICEGDTALLEAFGGVGYQWSNGSPANQIQISPSNTTIYRVTVSNALNCTVVDSASVIVWPNPVINIPDASFCLGGYTVLDAGNFPSATYDWSTGSTTDTIEVRSAGTYSVTVENNFGCIAADTSEVAVDTALTVNLQSDSLCSGQIYTLDAENTGADYSWNTGDTTQTIEIDQSGFYAVTVTDPFGCMGMDTASVYFYNRPVANAGSSDTICLGDTTILQASGGQNYSWSNGTVGTTNPVSPNQNTLYEVIVIDSNSCRDTASVNVIVNPLPNISAGPDLNLCNGDTAFLEASGASNYNWSNGINAAVNKIIATQDSTLIVLGTDTNACTASDTVMINVNDLPVADAGQDDTICAGATVLLVASGGDFYQWSNGSSNDSILVSPSPSVTTIYKVTVSDSFGCSATDSVKVMVNPLPIAVAGPDQSICQGDSVTLQASGGGDYRWSTGDTTSSIIVAPSSNTSYIVEVINAFSCSNYDTVNVQVNALPILSVTPDTIVCNGDFVTLNASGANTYQWNTGVNTSSITTQITKDSSFVVTGFNSFNCQSSDTILVQSRANPVVTVSSDTTVCSGESVLLEVRGAISYNWSTSSSDSNLLVTPTQNTAYQVAATDNFGCSSTEQVSVNVYGLPAFQLNDATFCTGGGTTISGPAGSYSYQWSTGDTSQALFVDIEDTYSLTVTDSNLCIFSDTALVKDSSLLIVTVQDQEICSGELATLNAGYPAADHLWSTGDTTQFITTDTAGIFIVEIQDTFGCTGSDTASVQVFANPSVSLGADTILCPQSILNFQVSSSGISIWNKTDTTNQYVYQANQDTSLFVQYIDTNSCQGFDIIQVETYNKPVLNVIGPDSACFNSEIILTAQGIGTLQWFNGDTTFLTETTVDQSRFYAATLTDSNACTVSDSAFVQSLALPNIDAGVDTFVCPGGSAALFAVTPPENDLSWNTGDTTASVTVSPSTDQSFIAFATDTFGCAASDTVLVEVSKLPAIQFRGLQSSYCVGDELDTLNLQPADGQLTGPGLNGFVFDPNAVPIDSVLTFNYSVTDSFGCSNSKQKQTIVYPLPNPTLSIVDTGFCANIIPVALSGAPFGGSFNGPGVSNDIFVPFYAGPGRHVINYTYRDSNQCAASDSQFVTVYPLPQPQIDSLPAQVCIDSAPLEIDLSPEGGQLTGPGLVGDSLFDPALTGAGGPFALIYSVTDSNGCSNFDFHEITVNALPQLYFNNTPSEVCPGNDTIALSATPSGGYFSGLGVDSARSLLVFDTAFNQTTIRYNYIDTISGCSNSISRNIKLLPKTSVEINNTEDTVCANIDYLELTANPQGGVFSGEGVRSGVFRPQGLVADSFYSIFYALSDTNNCISRDTLDLFVKASPDVEILNEDSAFCQGSIELEGSPAGGYFSGEGQYAGILYPDLFPAGEYTIQYIVKDAFNCVGTTSKTFVFEECTSVKEELMLQNIKVYPNPFESNITIEFGALKVNEVKLFDFTGKLILEKSLSRENAEISITIPDNLKSGLYFIEIKASQNSFIKKLIHR